MVAWPLAFVRARRVAKKMLAPATARWAPDVTRK
jgi:hypothetical protein